MHRNLETWMKYQEMGSWRGAEGIVWPKSDGQSSANTEILWKSRGVLHGPALKVPPDMIFPNK